MEAAADDVVAAAAAVVVVVVVLGIVADTPLTATVGIDVPIAPKVERVARWSVAAFFIFAAKPVPEAAVAAFEACFGSATLKVLSVAILFAASRRVASSSSLNRRERVTLVRVKSVALDLSKVESAAARPSRTLALTIPLNVASLFSESAVVVAGRVMENVAAILTVAAVVVVVLVVLVEAFVVVAVVVVLLVPLVVVVEPPPLLLVPPPPDVVVLPPPPPPLLFVVLPPPPPPPL